MNHLYSVIIITSHRVHESLGGVERFVASFSSWVQKKGIPVKVVSRSLSVSSLKITDGAFELEKTNKPFSVKKVQLPYALYCLCMGVFSFLAFLSLLRLIRSSRLTSNKPVIVHSQDMNFAAVATVLAGNLLAVPTILHQHGPYVDMLSGNSKRIEQILNIFSSRICTKMIVTDKVTQNHVARISGRKDCITVIPATVDSSVFNALIKTSSDCYTIGYIGRFSPEKNVKTLLIAFKDLLLHINGSCKLMLIGDGELRNDLIQLTTSLGIVDDVIFTGFQTNVLPFLSNIDVFVLPSMVEGTPLSLLEAMAAGKAIITSNIPSIQNIVKHGKSALLFNPKDPKELSRLLLLLCNDPELRSELGKNARTSAKQYDYNAIFPKVLQLYDHLKSI